MPPAPRKLEEVCDFYDLLLLGNIYMRQSEFNWGAERRAMAKPLGMVAAIRTFFTVCVIFLPSVLTAKRCDKQVDSYVWSDCMECSVNAFLPNPCPSGYSQVTSGEGEQRCSYRVHFGFNFGFMSVPGCQHNCTRKITIKGCCDEFWGQDCQGIVSVKIKSCLISVKRLCASTPQFDYAF